MAPSLARELRLLCDELDALPESSRVAGAHERCRDDSRLLELALSYLDPPEDGFLESPLELRFHQAHGAIAGFELEDEIGGGGYGRIFRARRGQQLAAVKLLRPGALASERARERFAREVDLLSRLNHDNVARLFSSGTTDNDQPFLVMELVEGDTLADFAEGSARTDRLLAFVAVCRGVEHAHQRMVVHGDLKPSNVLITRDDAVKVVDFGVARAMETAHEPPATPEPMTPAYASPEQLRGERIDALSDVYSLGVMLYELLYGSKPHDGSTPAELLEQIEQGAAASGVRPRTESPKARIDSDLVGIVSRATQADREQRYASTGELRRDVESFLSGQPVSFKQKDRGYLLRRFVQRNPVLSASAVALATLSAALAYQVREVRLQRDTVRSEARHAQAVTRFMTEVFTAAGPESSGGKPPTAVDLLERAVERIDRDYGVKEETRIRLLRTVAAANQGLGLLVRAEELLNRARDLAARTYGTEDPEWADVLYELGSLYWVQGRFDEAAGHTEQALAIRRQTLGAEHPETAAAWNNLGLTFQSRSRLEEARAAYEKALAIRRKVLSPGDPDRAVSSYNLAALAWQLGHYEEALPLLEEALDVWRSAYGEKHPKVVTGLTTIGAVHLALEDLGRANVFYDQAIELGEHVLGPDHPDLAIPLGNLAHVLTLQGNLTRAASLLTRALEISESKNGPDHPATATALHNLASVRRRQGDLANARLLYERALAVRRESLGSRAHETSLTMESLGTVLMLEGESREARQLLEEALAIQKELLPAEHPDLQRTLERLSEVDEAKREP